MWKYARSLKWRQFGAIPQHSIGQHPLTGQRAANFRLLANQWAERRLVTQWRHGCRAMRRSVCNTGASNAGRSLCVQISRERSYPLPIYRYHSKGTTTLPLRVFMVALCNRADHYIFILWFLSSSSFFFPRLISAAVDWMSTILPHMVWP